MQLTAENLAWYQQTARTSAFSSAYRKTVGNQSLTHPNEKPVALLEQLIEATTIPGALILDPFAGSGSTLAAAAKTGRQYIGIEIDEQYSKLAATRAAEHHQKGETT